MAWGNPDIDIMALMNPQWARWFDQTKAATGGKKLTLDGGASAPGSNQMRGDSVQPSLQALQGMVTPSAVTPGAQMPGFASPNNFRAKKAV